MNKINNVIYPNIPQWNAQKNNLDLMIQRAEKFFVKPLNAKERIVINCDGLIQELENTEKLLKYL